MSTKSNVEQPNAKTLKYVYFFGGGEAEGKGEMKDLLGCKGAGLAEMTNAGLPVPPGFTIQTEACREYVRQGSVPKEAHFQVECALSRLEALQGQKLGAGENPLLVSVRTGAKFSMPGLTGTIVNPRLERQKRGSASQAHQQSAICGGFVPAADPDVRQRGTGHLGRGI